ncbi:MAG: SPOR domain-containing protein, partial [Bacteroidia bacterium]
AHYSLNKGVLHPPSKKVLFNVQLKQNDGILAGWLKERLSCDFAEVNRHLADFAAYCTMLLDTKRRLEFESLGIFYLDFENNICFEPKTDINFLIESFGLSSITLKELEAEKTIEKPLIETKDRFEKTEVVEPKPPVRKRNYRRIAAIAVGLPVFAAALLFAASQMQPNSHFGATLFGTKNEAVYSPVNYSGNISEITLKSPEPYVVDANGYAGVNLLAENKTTVVNVSAVKTESKTIRPSHHTRSTSFAGKYQVVLGCFGVTQNADRLVNKLSKENISAGISGTNAKGLHIVSAGGFDDKESATALLMRIKDKCPSAWVMTQ